MKQQIKKYTTKLIADGSAVLEEIAFAAQDDVIIADGSPFLANLTKKILQHLDCLALLIAKPIIPFSDFLIKRAPLNEQTIIPRDTETRTFLHDIPILRKSEIDSDPVDKIVTLLSKRKGIIVEGIGIIATGALTVEQSYINWSSVFHSTYIKYLEDILENGFIFAEEKLAFDYFRKNLIPTISSDGLEFATTPFLNKKAILDEMTRVGRYTVQTHLVDSFFGNISYSTGELMYISQTASSLDELQGCIDPVPFTNSSTVGITASSELVAHRSIFETTRCHTILHGHPRFAVVMSMLCSEKESCRVQDCWKECVKVRFLGDTPLVAGEIGAGGIAKSVPPVIGKNGSAVVYGHGVFSIGMNDFFEAFKGLVNVENWCRNEYFRLLDEKHIIH